MTVGSVAEGASTGRRAALVALRDKLAAEVDGGGHVAGCGCDCGAPADGRVLATLAKQLAEILRELDALPGAGNGEVSQVVSLADRIADKVRGNTPATA